ncbi:MULTISPECIES: helix-turn-helix domain-containing protein [Aneurinibacillus]|uniref:Helix-turn-helix domain-containing protein n=1 Tax=Aneurinibacillus thermoaerophilus TaxID=143495 RepID=A0A1G7Y1U6_ANETH|nr:MULTISPECIES: helix-turn-helix domain-containing protein [Aneurinibacillus]AMA72960.1 transcriptional regulator [Aneurinibacillus sp. XH2]MED0675901.1 helix-turn-helix domain-containing protein [Aneurinibacillus thermoaerophilus]MED0677824.1 helix-turn-helix domain-containing protein [Aneurinibacillus thermoaerophilus]MED0737573.1 helix-turn-helix domain-containing protein [Aneurinibacillus thermoaerophilus]MED0758144.1 helix-turn-helix domain-containing protein [Aneurinibacillus thermoaero
MKQSKADLLLHPIRLRIVQALIGGRHLTAQQLIELLPDVPQASLYRHLNKLFEGDIIYVIDQRQVRGTTEKVYALMEQGANLTKDDLADCSRDEHMLYFLTFLASLQSDFQRYLQQEQFDLEADGVSYRKATLYVNDEEFSQLIKALRSVVEPFFKNHPAPGRRPRTLSTIIIPQPEQTSSNDNREGD